MHGQTVRHRPERGLHAPDQQSGPASRAYAHRRDLADFRSRDIAAGGQGGPLAPAFHATLLGPPEETRAVCNLGGISNLTLLPAEGAHGGTAGVCGFDRGPANALLDAWALRHLGKPCDKGGRFTASGKTDTALLAKPYFDLPPPKSTGSWPVFNPDPD